MKKHVMLIYVFSKLIIFLPFLSNAYGADEVISMRIRGMQEAEIIMSRIEESIIQENFKRLEQDALIIKNWAKIMLTLFPKGSAASVNNLSAASNGIWDKPILFKNLIEAKKSNAEKMVTASKEGNLEKFIEAFLATQKVCNSCHKKFRN